MLTAINEALSPLAAFTDVVRGEVHHQFCYSAYYQPTFQLCFERKCRDKPLTNNIRIAIIADISHRNTNPEVALLLEVAAFLDPRFKSKFVTDVEAIMDIACDDGAAIQTTEITQNPIATSELCLKRKLTLGSLLKTNDTKYSNSPTEISHK